jgi:cyclopropane fatty-acyl-phospholipid synthase-like methyltransferase
MAISEEPMKRIAVGLQIVPLSVACVLCLALLGLGCSAVKRFGYEGFDRDSWQQPERVVRELEIAPGTSVADLGAGGGYFTFRFAEAVGPQGRVFAVDVDEDMTSYLEERAGDEGYENVTVVLGRYEDPLLPDGQVDLLFTSNAYHHIQDRSAYFRRVLADLQPNGRVAVLELNDSSWFPRTFGHYTDPDEIIAEMKVAGYVLERDFDFVERQSFLIFRRADSVPAK